VEACRGEEILGGGKKKKRGTKRNEKDTGAKNNHVLFKEQCGKQRVLMR